jgi:flagellar motility protein MotE (MotC chaperone)
MNKLLESKYLAPLIGVIMYLLTLFLLLQGVMPEVLKATAVKAAPVKHPVEEKLWEPEPEPVALYEPSYRETSYDGKSWEFFNPELNKLTSELKKKRQELYDQSQHLEMVEKRILAEKKELDKLRSTIEGLKSEFNSHILSSGEKQAENLRRTAEVIRTMDRAKAVTLITSMTVPEAVRLMGFFTPEETADFFELMTAGGEEGLTMAAEISAGLRRSYLPDMPMPEEPEVEVKLAPGDSERLARLADFYAGMGMKDTYEILKSDPDEKVLKILLHMVPSMQQEFLQVMTEQGGAEARRAHKLSNMIHNANHDESIRGSIDNSMFLITREESRRLKDRMDLLAQMNDDQLLEYLAMNHQLLEIARLFKHLDKPRRDQLMLKVINENTFGERRSRELAELMNQMELEVIDEPSETAAVDTETLAESAADDESAPAE